jgi:hypothetical protein
MHGKNVSGCGVGCSLLLELVIEADTPHEIAPPPPSEPQPCKVSKAAAHACCQLTERALLVSSRVIVNAHVWSSLTIALTLFLFGFLPVPGPLGKGAI